MLPQFENHLRNPGHTGLARASRLGLFSQRYRARDMIPDETDCALCRDLDPTERQTMRANLTIQDNDIGRFGTSWLADASARARSVIQRHNGE
jgi:hypothetical protein